MSVTQIIMVDLSHGGGGKPDQVSSIVVPLSDFFVAIRENQLSDMPLGIIPYFSYDVP